MILHCQLKTTDRRGKFRGLQVQFILCSFCLHQLTVIFTSPFEKQFLYYQKHNTICPENLFFKLTSNIISLLVFPQALFVPRLFPCTLFLYTTLCFNMKKVTLEVMTPMDNSVSVTFKCIHKQTCHSLL